MDIQLYTQTYTGTKNYAKQKGKQITGIAVQIIPEMDSVILRDADNYSHSVSMISIQKINTKK